MYIDGRKASDFYITRVNANQLGDIPEVTEQAVTWVHLTTDYFILDSPSPTPLNVSTQSFSEAAPGGIFTDLTYTPNIVYPAAFHSDDFYDDILSGQKLDLNFTWACSNPNNITALSFTLEQLDGEEVPSWVVLDPSNEVISLNKTPLDEEITQYKFSLKIDATSQQRLKNFYLNIGSCQVDNCQTCTRSNFSICEECTAGYLLDQNGSCKEAENTGFIAVAATIMAVGVTASAATSITSMTSTNGMFSMINQFQLYFFLPMIGSYFPPTIMDFILGMDFTMFSFDFINIESWGFVQDMNNWISYPQVDSYLEELGQGTGSTILNNLSLIFVILQFVLIHLSNYDG